MLCEYHWLDGRSILGGWNIGSVAALICCALPAMPPCGVRSPAPLPRRPVAAPPAAGSPARVNGAAMPLTGVFSALRDVEEASERARCVGGSPSMPPSIVRLEVRAARHSFCSLILCCATLCYTNTPASVPDPQLTSRSTSLVQKPTHAVTHTTQAFDQHEHVLPAHHCLTTQIIVLVLLR